MKDPVIRAACAVAWDEAIAYSDRHLECDLEFDSGDTCDGCPTCQPVNPYRGLGDLDGTEINTSAAAALEVLSAFVSSPDTLRRLSHMARLARLNGHDETAETMTLIADIGIRSNPIPTSAQRASKR